MSNARTIPWETIADWFAKNEQAIRDVMKFEGLRGAVNEVLRIAPEQPELAALREELAETQQISQQEELRANEYATQLVAAEQRNAELVELLSLVRKDGGFLNRENWDRIDAALKPTESGASE